MQLRVRPPLLLAAALIASSPAFAQPPVETPTADTPDEASKLFKKGNDAYKLKKWDEAEKAFREAWALKQSYDIAGNWGDVEVYLGRYRDAAEHLEYSLRNWPAGQEASKRRTQERFAEAKQHVGTLSLKVSEGAEITVNGKAVGKSPLPGPVFIEPGAATIEAKIGDKSARKTVALDVGEARELEIVIEGEAAAVGPEAEPAAGPSRPDPGAGGSVKADSSGMKPRTVALIAGAGLTVVAAGVGVFYTLKKSSAQDDANGLRSELSSKFGGQACSGSSAPAQCADLTDALERRDDAAQISTGAFVASGVLLAATAVAYFVWPAGHESSPKAGRVNLFATPQSRGAMMGVVGSF